MSQHHILLSPVSAKIPFDEGQSQTFQKHCDRFVDETRKSAIAPPFNETEPSFKLFQGQTDASKTNFIVAEETSITFQSGLLELTFFYH